VGTRCGASNQETGKIRHPEKTQEAAWSETGRCRFQDSAMAGADTDPEGSIRITGVPILRTDSLPQVLRRPEARPSEVAIHETVEVAATIAAYL
jgi:hypothetical protein